MGEARTGRVRGLPLSASGYSPLARRCKVHAREACLATGFAAGSPPPKARLWDWARTGTAKRGNSLGPECCGLARNVLRLPIAKSNSLYYLVHLGLTSRTSEQQQQPSLFAVVPRHLVTSVYVQTCECVPRCASAPTKTKVKSGSASSQKFTLGWCSRRAGVCVRSVFFTGGGTSTLPNAFWL